MERDEGISAQEKKIAKERLKRKRRIHAGQTGEVQNIDQIRVRERLNVLSKLVLRWEDEKEMPMTEGAVARHWGFKIGLVWEIVQDAAKEG